MPLDTSIYGDIKTFTPNSPVQTAAQLAGFEELQNRIQQDRQARVDDAAMRQAMAQSNGDYETAIHTLNAGGQPSAAAMLQDVWDKHSKATAEALEAHNKAQTAQLTYYSQLAGLMTGPSSFDSVLGTLSPQDRAQAQQFLGDQYDPDRVKAVRESMLTEAQKATMRHEAFQDWQASAKTTQDGVRTLATYLANTPQAQWGQMIAGAKSLQIPQASIDFVQQNAQTPEQMQALAQKKEATEKGGQHVEGMYKGRRTFGVFDPNTNTYNVDGKQVSASEFTPIPPASLIIHNQTAATPVPQTIEEMAKGSGFTPAGLRKAAEKYHEKGDLEALGNRAAAKQAIMNAEALLYPKGDLAMTSASFKANQGSLNQLTKQLGAVQAYEQTGLANLKQFTDLAAKIPDTGVPWLNTPVRALSANLVGSANMAAVNAARQVALTEISKVVNNPNLTGSLSDSAREEVLGLIPENATFAQIKRVAQVLQRDMANRPLAMKQQIDRIKYEMAHPGETMPETAAPSAAPTQTKKIGRFTVTVQ